MYINFFIKRNLFDYEPRTHHWIRVAKKVVDKVRIDNNAPAHAGFDYTTSIGEEMVEFHVDDCKAFGHHMNDNSKYGGELSNLLLNVPREMATMWRESNMLRDGAGYDYKCDGLEMTEVHGLEFFEDQRTNLKQQLQQSNFCFSFSVRPPIMILGQDEAIFKQYIMNIYQWVARDGSKALQPKDDGMGLMASAVQCRELPFGFKLNDEQLNAVNSFGKMNAQCTWILMPQ